MKRTIILGLMFLLLFGAVFAQVADSDEDGVSDDYDRCPNTPFEEELPLFKNNLEYVGCSCTEIVTAVRAAGDCNIVFCESGRPLSILETDDPECLNPAEPILIKEEEEEVQEKKFPQITSNDIFDILISKDGGKLLLDGTNRGTFNELVYSANENYLIETKVEEQMIGLAGNNQEVPVYTIKITPNKGYKLKDVYVYEKLRNKEPIDLSNTIFDSKTAYVDGENGLFVWYFDEIKEETTISYRINERFKYDTVTFVSGKVMQNLDLSFFLPIIIFLVIIIGTIVWFQISISKNKIK